MGAKNSWMRISESDSELDEEASLVSLSRGSADSQRWLDLMSTGKEGEELREDSRALVDRYDLRCLAALTYERLMVLLDCKATQQQQQRMLRTGSSHQRLDAQISMLQLQTQQKQAKKELEESDFLVLVPEDESERGLKHQLDNISRWEAAFFDWVRELNALSPKMFVENLTLLRIEYGQENLNRFLQSLSLELTWPRVEARIKRMSGVASTELSPWEVFKPQERNFCVVGCEDLTGRTAKSKLKSFVASVSKEKFERQGASAWEAWHVIKQFGSKMLSGEHALIFEATYSITPAVQLFELSSWDLTMALKALVDAGQVSQCFNTVLGKAILKESLRRTFMLRAWYACLDLLLVILLTHLGSAAQRQQTPDRTVIWAFGMLSSWIFMSCLCKIFVGLYFFVDCASFFTSLLAAVGRHLTLWNFLITASELYSATVGLQFLSCIKDPKLTGFNYFETHPVMISVLVLIRWALLSIDFFQIEEIGRRVVPIVHAVSRPASVYFLFFLALMLAGSFQAYSVFPIEENVGGANTVLNTFLKIFRLEVLGGAACGSRD